MQQVVQTYERQNRCVVEFGITLTKHNITWVLSSFQFQKQRQRNAGPHRSFTTYLTASSLLYRSLGERLEQFTIKYARNVLGYGDMFIIYGNVM